MVGAKLFLYCEESSGHTYKIGDVPISRKVETMMKKFYGLLAGLATLFPLAEGRASHEPAETKLGRSGFNTASLKSIESSWIEVPRSCKAKGFNAEPITVIHGPLRAEVAAIYGLFPT